MAQLLCRVQNKAIPFHHLLIQLPIVLPLKLHDLFLRHLKFHPCLIESFDRIQIFAYFSLYLYINRRRAYFFNFFI